MTLSTGSHSPIKKNFFKAYTMINKEIIWVAFEHVNIMSIKKGFSTIKTLVIAITWMSFFVISRV